MSWVGDLYKGAFGGRAPLFWYQTNSTDNTSPPTTTNPQPEPEESLLGVARGPEITVPEIGEISDRWRGVLRYAVKGGNSRLLP